MKKLWIIFFLAFLPPHVSFAIKVSNLYQVELPVISQSPEFKEEAMRTGLLQVLIKLTGDPLIDKNPLIKTSLQKADYYVQEFGYSTVTTNSATYLIQIRFDNHSINRLLKKAGVLYWGEIRPLILVWLAYTNKHHFTEIIGNETSKNIALDVKEQGKRYGLPLIFPVMDMEEVNDVPTTAVVSMELPVLKAAAKRYSPDALLVGHIEEQEDGLQSEWQLSLKNNKWTWSASGKTADEVIAFVMDRISQTLAKHYAVTHITTPKSEVELEVSHIRHRLDLRELIRHLEQLPPVLDIKLTEINGDVVNLSVLVRGPLEAFENHAALTRHLILHPNSSNDKSNDNKISYEWVSHSP
jgi:hypothetical protein